MWAQPEPRGATGPTGPPGEPGPKPTSTAGFAANTIGSIISTLLGPGPVPLPNAQVLSPDITVNGTNTVFTVATAGRYRISYQINTTLALLVGSRLVVNGSVYPPSEISSVVSLFSKNEVIVDLAANSTIMLQLFGLLGVTTLLNNCGGGNPDDYPPPVRSEGMITVSLCLIVKDKEAVLGSLTAYWTLFKQER